MIPRRLARLLLVLALVGAGALVFVVGRSTSQNFDRNDPAAVLAAIRTALRGEIHPESICLAIPPHFPDLVIVRVVVPDAGCLPQGLFLRGQWQRIETGTLDRIGREQLAARGWASADAAARRDLALQWVVEALYPDRAVTETTRLPPALQAAGLPLPEARSRPDGGVEVRISVVNMTVAGPIPARVTVIIGADGTAGR